MAEDAHIFDTTRWQRLESPQRLARLDPPALIARLGLHAGAHVADLGSGTGIFTVELARAVGPTGRVFALDRSPEMLEVAGTKALPPWVRVMQADLSHELPLPDGSLDCCFMALVLHELAPPEAIAQMHRLVRGGGTVAVLEWRDDTDISGGPDAAHRIGTAALSDMLLAAGFENPAVPWQSDREYLLVATRPDRAR